MKTPQPNKEEVKAGVKKTLPVKKIISRPPSGALRPGVPTTPKVGVARKPIIARPIAAVTPKPSVMRKPVVPRTPGMLA